MCRRQCESQSLFVSLCGPPINWQLHPALKCAGESENRKLNLSKPFLFQGFRRLGSITPASLHMIWWRDETPNINELTNTRSLSTRLAKVALARCEALLPCQHRLLLLLLLASKQAGQVLLGLEQHQGLICVYSTQHLTHNPAGNHGDGLWPRREFKK